MTQAHWGCGGDYPVIKVPKATIMPISVSPIPISHRMDAYLLSKASILESIISLNDAISAITFDPAMV